MGRFTTAPGVIVALPQLEDSNFHRSVVVMIEHDEEGAVGLVINNETKHRCVDVIKGFGLGWSGSTSLMLGRGGPVEPNGLWILHGDGWFFEETMKVSDGVAVSRSKDALTRMCEADEESLCLFIGYAGWGAGQLEDEIAHGAWLTAPFQPEMIFDWPRDEVWERTLNILGVNPAFLVSGGGLVQ